MNNNDKMTVAVKAYEVVASFLMDGVGTAEEARACLRGVGYISIFDRFEPTRQYSYIDSYHEVFCMAYDKSNELWLDITRCVIARLRHEVKTGVRKGFNKITINNRVVEEVIAFARNRHESKHFSRLVTITQDKINAYYNYFGSDLYCIENA